MTLHTTTVHKGTVSGEQTKICSHAIQGHRYEKPVYLYYSNWVSSSLTACCPSWHWHWRSCFSLSQDTAAWKLPVNRERSSPRHTANALEGSVHRTETFKVHQKKRRTKYIVIGKNQSACSSVFELGFLPRTNFVTKKTKTKIKTVESSISLQQLHLLCNSLLAQ